MTIEQEITKLNANLTNSYTACQNKGATMPANQNFDNLADTIDSIHTGSTPVIKSLNVTPSTTAQTITAPSGTDGYSPVNVSAVTSSIDANITAGNIKKDVTILDVTGTYEGTTPTLTTKTITQNGTYNASSDNADGYSSVTVNVPDIGVPREISRYGTYQTPSSNFTFSLPSNVSNIGWAALRYAFWYCSTLVGVDLSNITTLSGFYALNYAFSNCSNLTSVDLSSLTTISADDALSYAFHMDNALTSVDLSSLTTVSGSSALYNSFSKCSSLVSVSFPELTTVNTTNSTFSYAFSECSSLTSATFPKLQRIGTNNSNPGTGCFGSCFYGCNNLTSLTFPELTEIYCTGSSSAFYGTFYNNNKIEKMYFPKLNTITYGIGASTTNQNACKNIFYGCSSLTELHFGSANQSAIEATDGYSTAWGRGAGNVTIYFDL